MELKLAESLVEACRSKGVRATLKEDYSAAWMRGHKTTGVVLPDGDLAQVIAAVITAPQLFIHGDAPKFAVEDTLRVSPFQLSLILY